MNNNSTSIAPQQSNGVSSTVPQQQQAPRDVKSLLNSDAFKLAVTKSLPRHLPPDRFVRIALNATMRNPRLLQCTQESLFKCLLDLSSYGLEPDGRRAHLIPFSNKGKLEAQLIIDYKGIVELVRRSGEVSYIHADAVYAEDVFEYSYGTTAGLKHVPSLDRRTKLPTQFYSYVRLKDGSEDFLVISKGDVDKIRARSKAKDSGPWITDYDEMGKKTAFRRHSKWLPLSTELREVIERDDDLAGLDREANDDAVDRLNAALQNGTEQPSLDPVREIEHQSEQLPTQAASHPFSSSQTAIAAFAGLKIEKGHLIEKLDGRTPEQWDEADLATLKSIHGRIMEGDIAPADFFPNL